MRGLFGEGGLMPVCRRAQLAGRRSGGLQEVAEAEGE